MVNKLTNDKKVYIADKTDENIHIWLREQKNGILSCKVHSVYDKVVNIISCDKEKFFSISSAETIQSPMMIKLTENISFTKSRERIYVDDIVEKCDENSIRIGNFIFDCSKSRLWSGKIPIQKPDYKNISENTIKTIEFILKNGKDSGLLSAWKHYYKGYEHLETNDVYAKIFFDKLSKLQNSIVNDNYKEFIKIIYEFIGLGIGLTPSGDDFILGLLSVFKAYEFHPYNFIIKNECIEDLKSRSTTVSYFMLKNCIQGFINEALLKFIQNDCEKETILNNILKIGSTSGTDMLIGVVFALNILLQKYSLIDWRK